MEIKKMLDKNGLEYYTGKIKQQIPKKTSDLTNDSNFIDNTYHDNSKQDTLVSGTNIKTINNESLLGSGNISIQGGGTSTDVKINGTSITSGDTANIAVEGTYNASTNKLMTKSEVDGYDASWIYTSTPSVADFNAFYNYVDNGGIRVYVTSQYDDQINTELVEGVEIGEWGDEKYISIYSVGDLLRLICDGTQVTKKDVQLFERSYNKVTSLSSSSKDTQYPSAKCVYDNLATKQAALVSGTNIKTINNTSILGNGNLDILNMVYPVGSIYMSVNSTNPATLFGGTWKAISQGRTLVGVGTWSDINGHKMTWTAETTGGEYFHTLTTNEMPSHTHEEKAVANPNSGGPGIRGTFNSQEGSGFTGYGTGVPSGNSGGGRAHNNLQPFFVVYMWKRTA